MNFFLLVMILFHGAFCLGSSVWRDEEQRKSELHLANFIAEQAFVQRRKRAVLLYCAPKSGKKSKGKLPAKFAQEDKQFNRLMRVSSRISHDIIHFSPKSDSNERARLACNLHDFCSHTRKYPYLRTKSLQMLDGFYKRVVLYNDMSRSSD